MFAINDLNEVETLSVNEVVKNATSTIESAPPGAAIPQYCSANVEWFSAFHEPFICCMADGNPDVQLRRHHSSCSLSTV